MSNNAGPMDPTPRGQCPFLNSQCIGEDCELWVRLPVTQPSPLTGINRSAMMSGCIFSHLLQATVMLGRAIQAQRRQP